MTDLNIRIAKIRGWTRFEKAHDGRWFGYEPGDWPIKSPLPNWSGSLDLMHELIMELSGYEFEIYLMHLGEIIYPVDLDFAVCDQHVIGAYKRQLYEATAAQKAEAWCRCKEGK